MTWAFFGWVTELGGGVRENLGMEVEEVGELQGRLTDGNSEGLI